jgi:hypothetical protein
MLTGKNCRNQRKISGVNYTCDVEQDNPNPPIPTDAYTIDASNTLDTGFLSFTT